MFVDYVKVNIKAGDGGNGCVAFRREKYVPFGGPAGGNGGNGGNVIFVADEGVSTLVSLRYNSLVKAGNGSHGLGSSMHGKNCEDTHVSVPVGTVIKDEKTGEIIADLVEHDQSVVVCHGGRGGRGNKFFKSNSNKAPKISENGEAGEEKTVIVELKLLADVGLIGFPNVGKSTFISMVTNVKPKIANYPFTTIIPNLGVARTKDNREFVIADMPGLIEGASSGKGLGHQFLKHIERTSVLCHIIDMSGENSEFTPIESYLQINKELKEYDESLLLRPQIIVANKMDLGSSDKNLIEFKKELPDLEVYETTAITKTGLDKVIYRLADLVESTPRFSIAGSKQEEVDHVTYTFEGREEEFKVSKIDDRIYEITGEKIEKIFLRTNFDQEDSVLKFASTLRKMGIEDELRKIGCVDGDVVRIMDFEFEMHD
ncbi:MAG: GTPase ObgE [Bacilli bacterium]